MKKLTRELKEKSLSELEKEATKLMIEITKLQLEMKSNPPKDTNTLGKKKKRLAATLTMHSEKKEIEKLKKTRA